MVILKIVFPILFLIIAVILVTSFVCFMRIFYSPRRRKTDEFPIPNGKIYEKHRASMIKWIQDMRSTPHRDVSIRSFDGLTLRGKYFEYSKDAPIEILFHGYKGSAERDLSGGIARCFSLGHNALIVDHRASGESDGHVITFGINESRDCADWVDFVLREIDPNAKIILTGISMGAATVLIASAMDLPENVVGVLADCGYTSARAIIKKVVKEMKLPSELLYPFVRLGGLIFGHFDIDKTSPIESMKKSRLPIIFFHGDTDDYVPFEMSVENHEACITKKKLVKIEGAGHGLCFPTNTKKYLSELNTFFETILSKENN